VLFSNDLVARYVNARFEPAWEMVREVPLVHVDFGGGRVVTRTLHGNVLTSVCTADGVVLDALPGIYNVAGYLDQLNQLRLLHQNFARQPAPRRGAWLRDYHARQAARIAGRQPAERFADALAVAPVTKRAVEAPVERLLAVAAQAPPGPPAGVRDADVARWKELEEDTRLNETARRRQIHELLSARDLARPAAVLRPIYRDVLHADLDDPYLGLGPALFADYPFAREDEGRWGPGGGRANQNRNPSSVP
jgi:hypothetical protein